MLLGGPGEAATRHPDELAAGEPRVRPSPQTPAVPLVHHPAPPSHPALHQPALHQPALPQPALHQLAALESDMEFS